MHYNDAGLIWEKRMLQQIQIRHKSLGHSNEHRKGLWHPFVTKAQNNNGQTYLNTVKATHHKPMVNFILSGENLNAFPQRSGRRQGCLPTFHSSVRSLSFSYRVKEKGKSGWEGGEGRRLNIPLGKWKYPVYVEGEGGCKSTTPVTQQEGKASGFCVCGSLGYIVRLCFKKQTA